MPKSLNEKRAEVLLCGSQSLLESMPDKVLEQIRHVAALPGLVGAAMTMPDAYNDVNLVAEATEQADLARQVAFLKPKICIKG